MSSLRVSVRSINELWTFITLPCLSYKLQISGEDADAVKADLCWWSCRNTVLYLLNNNNNATVERYLLHLFNGEFSSVWMMHPVPEALTQWFKLCIWSSYVNLNMCHRTAAASFVPARPLGEIISVFSCNQISSFIPACSPFRSKWRDECEERIFYFFLNVWISKCVNLNIYHQQHV